MGLCARAQWLEQHERTEQSAAASPHAPFPNLRKSKSTDDPTRAWPPARRLQRIPTRGALVVVPARRGAETWTKVCLWAG